MSGPINVKNILSATGDFPYSKYEAKNLTQFVLGEMSLWEIKAVQFL